jgi:tRNA threonylcarbamoyladenosine biosynthesis protein TsaB
MTGVGSRRVVLALDAGGAMCSAAVAIDDILASAERCESPRGQAEILLPMADRVLSEAGLSPAALDLLAVTVGPGSFTGIRIGLAAARGIAVATGARLIGVTSFDAVAVGAERPNQWLLVALESRREDLYVQFFDPWHCPVGEPAAMRPQMLGDTVNAVIGVVPLMIAGDAAQRAAASLSRRADITVLQDSAPDAVGALRAALRHLRSDEGTRTAKPFYLRPAGVTLPPGHRN